MAAASSDARNTAAAATSSTVATLPMGDGSAPPSPPRPPEAPTGPSTRAFTLMCCGPWSKAMAMVSELSAALLAERSALPLSPSELMEEMLMTAPPPPLAIAGMACRPRRTTRMMSAVICSSNSSSVMSTTVPKILRTGL